MPKQFRILAIDGGGIRGLIPAVRELCARMHRELDIPVIVESGPPADVPSDVETLAYRVIQEALANAAKHSGATEVEVRVDATGGTLQVEVSDDGVGGADPAQGSGLRGLADRVAALNGTLEVESVLGEGTTIRAEIPLG